MYLIIKKAYLPDSEISSLQRKYNNILTLTLNTFMKFINIYKFIRCGAIPLNEAPYQKGFTNSKSAFITRPIDSALSSAGNGVYPQSLSKYINYRQSIHTIFNHILTYRMNEITPIDQQSISFS